MASTLADYLSATQRLLHDSQNIYWTQTELTSYVNSGMQRVSLDTGCVRTTQTFTLVAGTAQYNFSVLGNPQVFDVIGIWVLYGATRLYCRQVAFSTLITYYQPWQGYQSVPVAFARNGPSTIAFGPVPGTAYATEWDCCVYPSPLVAPTDADPSPYPYTEAVPFYAAYLAKIAQQQKSEADFFFAIYQQRILEASNARQRMLPDIYDMEDAWGLP